MVRAVWRCLLAFATILFFAFFVAAIGPQIGGAIYSKLAEASPILGRTVLGHITFFAVAGLLSGAVVDVIARLMNFAINGWFAKGAELRQRIRAIFDEDGRMMLEFFAFPSIFLGFVFFRSELRLLEAGELVPVFGVYQDALISGAAMAAIFELLVILTIITTYDLVK